MFRLNINEDKCLYVVFCFFFFLNLNIPDLFLQRLKQTFTFKEHWIQWEFQTAALKKKISQAFLFTFKHWITCDDLVLLA